MKKLYGSPELEIISFKLSDVLATSYESGYDTPGGGPVDSTPSSIIGDETGGLGDGE